MDEETPHNHDNTIQIKPEATERNDTLILNDDFSPAEGQLSGNASIESKSNEYEEENRNGTVSTSGDGRDQEIRPEVPSSTRVRGTSEGNTKLDSESSTGFDPSQEKELSCNTFSNNIELSMREKIGTNCGRENKCLICGYTTGSVTAEYTTLCDYPEIKNEVHELLKILIPQDEADFCCNRCLGLMEKFVRLKKEYQDMKRKIIALHVDAQLELREISNRKMSESEKHPSAKPRDDLKLQNSIQVVQDDEMLVKHENIDLDFVGDNDSVKEEEDKEEEEEEDTPQRRKNPPRRKTFKCQHCVKKFRRKDELIVHQRTHTGERPFKCQFCDSTFYRRNTCVKHEKKHLDKPYRCKFCVRNFSTEEECEKHEGTHTLLRPHQCQYCDKTFARKGECILHERTHTGEKPFRCEHCDKSFFRKNACVKHQKKKHKGVVSTKKSDVTSLGTFKCEKVENVEAKPYKCSHCEKNFKRKWECIAHERIHTGERPFKCQHCDKTFIRKNSCIKHEKKHSVKSFKCSHCSKTCLAKRALIKHEKTHFGGKPYKCRGCDKTFAWRTQWEEHERIHTGEKPFLCQYCDKRFTQSSTCFLHERTQHTGERPFKCQYCDQAFATKGYREVHERFHTGEKPFKCSYCGKGFIRKGNCRDHERTHTGIKQYVCLYCGKGFFDKSDCLIHERIHTGERPFKCQYCDKTYITKKHCIQHERTHTGEKPAKKQQTLNNLELGDAFKNQSLDSTFKNHHSENLFRTQIPDSMYMSQNSNEVYRNQLPESNAFRLTQSSNAFPTPEVVYQPGDPPYLYGMYMPGI